MPQVKATINRYGDEFIVVYGSGASSGLLQDFKAAYERAAEHVNWNYDRITINVLPREVEEAISLVKVEHEQAVECVEKNKRRLEYMRLKAEFEEEDEQDGVHLMITHPGDDVKREKCSFCGKELKCDQNCDECELDCEEEAAVNTCTHTEYVTLCRPCYIEAGNSVR